MLGKTSPSQCETYERCPRLWWFRQVARMEPPSGKSQAFGTFLHDLCAEVIDPCHSSPPADVGLLPDEARLAHRLVDLGVWDGVLTKRAHVTVEEPFSMSAWGQTIAGRIDVLGRTDAIVEDHKAIKDKKWALTPEQLSTDMAMMIYAGFLLAELKDNHQDITLRHNVFVMDTVEVFTVEAVVTAHEVMSYWKGHLFPIVQGQVRDAQKPDWDLVSGHSDSSDACTGFGGCAFAPVCHNGVPLTCLSKSPSDGDAPF